MSTTSDNGLCAVFSRMSQAAPQQPSISRTLPSLPQLQSTALYRHTQSYTLPSPVSTVPSPPLAQAVYTQRSASSSAQELYYRQQQLSSPVSAPTPSSSMRASALMSSSSSSAPMRRAQLEYAQTQTQYASPSPPAAAYSSAGAVAQRYRSSAAEDSLGWYRRPAFTALEPYTASACT